MELGLQQKHLELLKETFKVIKIIAFDPILFMLISFF